MGHGIAAIDVIDSELLAALEAGDTERAGELAGERDQRVRALASRLDRDQCDALYASDVVLQSAVSAIRERVLTELGRLRTGRSAVAAYGSVSIQR